MLELHNNYTIITNSSMEYVKNVTLKGKYVSIYLIKLWLDSC